MGNLLVFSSRKDNMPDEGILSTLAVLKFLGGKLVCCKSNHDDKLDKTKLKSRVRAKLNQGSKQN